jgi:Baseplate J-like protein
MTIDAPPIDVRTAPDVVGELVVKLREYTTASPGQLVPYQFHPWHELDPMTQEPTGASAALIGIFSRFAELIIQRLNLAPDKNFKAFLDLLGASQRPPEPARVPLTFTLVAGRVDGAPVPAGTKVAAVPAPGDTAPVVFEVDESLVVSPAQLSNLVTLDPPADLYQDWGAAPGSPLTVFQGERPIEHALYLGDSKLFGYSAIADLKVDFTVATGPGTDLREVVWEVWDGSGWSPLAGVSDGTQSLRRTGSVDLHAPLLLERSVNGRSMRWVRGRLVTPISPVPLDGGRGPAGMVRDADLPIVSGVTTVVQVDRSPALTPDAGFANGTPLDLTKHFSPFGERPRLSDALYLASAEGFARDPAITSATVKLDVEVANSILHRSPDSVRPSADAVVAWECWDGSNWVAVGLGAPHPKSATQIDLDPTPVSVSKPELAYQGTVRTNVPVTAGLYFGGDPGATNDFPASLDASGRFSGKIALTPDVVNVVLFKATDARAAVVVAHGNAKPATMTVTAIPAEVVTETKVSLDLVLSGAAAEEATVTAFNLSNNQSIPVPAVIAGHVVFDVPNLQPGRNEILVEAKKGSTRVGAAVVSIGSKVDTPAPVNGFSDGTYAFSQSGRITIPLPSTVARAVVGGQENQWLRARLIKGDYGREASYALKDPTDLGAGFTLVPATFRPPSLSRVNVGYLFAAQRAPEVIIASNQLTFTEAAVPFRPFTGIADQEHPALYLGFSSPRRRDGFPNTPITAYAFPASATYGDRPLPVAPDIRGAAGDPGGPVVHHFELENAATIPRMFTLAVRGNLWESELTAPSLVNGSITVAPGAIVEVDVLVTVPEGAPTGARDRGFLQVGSGDIVHTSFFVTEAGVPPSPVPPRLIWEYWNGLDWTRLAVRDETSGFTFPGPIQFLPPADFSARSLFGREQFWLRVSWENGDFSSWPRLSRLMLNTTTATQHTSINNEVLGSSNGGNDQRFRTTRVPVLSGQHLEVREQELPTAEERKVLRAQEGDDAIRVIDDAAGRPREIWVRWHEVPDFYASASRDRHYVLDHLTGEIRFGNGINGRIPPVGPSNLRLSVYRTGGGLAGNRPAGTITQLKTTVPYLDKVTNPEAASGGAEAEPIPALLDRVPRTLRHRDRSVTPEDYEDLTMATPGVARALCVPLRDLAADALGADATPGVVSVVVVPRTADAKPLPTLDLLGRVERTLAARTPVTSSLAVVGPLYLKVDVQAEVAVTSLDQVGNVESAVQERLAAFLHPLTGGLDGAGWGFGRAPHRSDLMALIEAVAGVDHIRFLGIVETEDRPGVRETGRYLVHSGQHQIDLVLEEG